MKLRRLDRWSLAGDQVTGFVDEGMVSVKVQSCTGRVLRGEVEGRLESYILGEAAPTYVAYVESRGQVFNPHEPLGSRW